MVGQHEKALIDFDRAIELDGNYTWAIASRGETYRRMGEYDKALVDFDRAIELNEDYTWAIASRGRTYRAKGDSESALTDYERALQSVSGEQQSDHSWIWTAKAQVLVDMQRHQEAKAVHQIITDIAPEEAWAYGNAGWDCYRMGEFDEAIVHGQKAVDIESEDAVLHYNLALYNLAQGNREQAVEIYRRATELDSGLLRIDEAVQDIVEAQEKWPAMDRLQQGLEFLRAVKAGQAQ